ncbi:alpha/beta fold hydrolase [Nocardiopsis suaedae]|uniref:Alpha/beta hydrolase n=1 Tax=Nocardiopsis suaedae TaxID=3018444 RepID=A0ABT4TVF1_9ACTN|nr:alpha/beta hydrolase [Nocardiopsis suaedae]MDA2808386.1 alpha/beta hydrolase [Nocardiopsis suaedae]
MTPQRHQRTVESADGTLLNVETTGPDDGPVLVLVHGWTCATPFWAPVVNRLPRHVRTVMYDQRGHGSSARPATAAGYSTTALADDLCAVLEAAVPAGTPAVLAGHSMGGMTIMSASRRPAVRDRAAAAALISTGSSRLPHTSTVLPLGPDDSAFRAAVHRAALGAPLPLGPRTPLTRAAIRYITMAPGADRRMKDVTARLVHAMHPVARARWGTVLGTLEADEGLRALDVPAAVVHGTRDRLIPFPHAPRTAGLLPDCRTLVEIPGTGHMTPLEAPDRVAAVLTDLIDAHLPGPASPGTANGKASRSGKAAKAKRTQEAGA